MAAMAAVHRPLKPDRRLVPLSHKVGILYILATKYDLFHVDCKCSSLTIL